MKRKYRSFIQRSNMKTKDAVKKAGSVTQLAELLGLSIQAVYKWDDYVPTKRAAQLEAIWAKVS